MSVIVIGHMTVEPANVEKLWFDRKADFEAVREAARAAGALRHQWAFGEGQVVIIDIWPDAGSFQKFFDGNPKFAKLMQAGGVQGPPTIEVLDARSGPDSF